MEADGGAEPFAGGAHARLAEPARREERDPGKREVDLYVRTYTTLLQSSGTIGVASLEPAHVTAAASLHAGVLEPEPDLNAFIYSVQRLPASIVDVREILLGQSPLAFRRAGYDDLASWRVESAPGRRRRWLYDGEATLAVFAASASDLDDLIPTIVAYQIEWNKIHRILQEDEGLRAAVADAAEGAVPPSGEALADIGRRLLLDEAGWARLQSVWGARLWPNLAKIAAGRKRYQLRMLGSSYVGYVRATRQWWAPVQRLLVEKGLADRPVYFISSNTHSFVNVLSGAARRRREALTRYIRATGDRDLVPELDKLESGELAEGWDNLLYFAARSYFMAPEHAGERDERTAEEREQGMYHVEPSTAVDVGVQVIDLAKLRAESFDPRLCGEDEAVDPGRTDAVVINVNYPLGFGAYHLMTQVATAFDQIRGIYVLGKAATLNGRIGDVMLANVVFDEHSENTYWFENCFGYEDIAPYLRYGAALDNQKAVTVKGTYLQNKGYLDFYYRENYTVVEMEAGPYLSAVYEDLMLRRHPSGEAINLHGLAGGASPGGIDLGIIHYASDTPYSRAQTLGARGLSYYGMDSTYASTIAILRRVLRRSGVLTSRESGVG